MLNRRTLLAASGIALAALLGVVSISCADGAWNYVEPGAVMLERVLPPPPAGGSAAERAELDAMLNMQAARTPA